MLFKERRLQPAFPVAATIRKGSPMGTSRRAGYKGGDDLGQFFRVEFKDPKAPVARAFEAKYGAAPVDRIFAVCPFPSVWSAWDCWNECYNAGALIARADGDHYTYLRDPLSGEVLVRDGQPFKPFAQGDKIEYVRNGQKFSLDFKPTGRLRLWLPNVSADMVFFELKTTSYYDCMNITQQLAAIQSIADAVKGGNAAGVPFYLYRQPQSISYAQGGQLRRTEKWIIQIQAAPEFMRNAGALLTAMATGDLPALQPGELTGPVDPDLDHDTDDEPVDGSFAPAPEPAHEPEPEPAAASRPLPPGRLRDMLHRRAAAYDLHGKAVTPKQTGLVALMINKHLAGKDDPDAVRRAMIEYLFGVDSLNRCTAGQVLALLDWIKPAPSFETDELYPCPDAVVEAQGVRAALLEGRPA